MKSCKNHSTLGYFCSMLGRMPNANDHKKDMNACTDALFTVLKGHYVACACKILQLQDPTAKCPSVDALEGKSKMAKLLQVGWDPHSLPCRLHFQYFIFQKNTSNSINISLITLP